MHFRNLCMVRKNWFVSPIRIFHCFFRCGTIMDFIVAMITNSDEVTTSDQLAASWGFYNTVDAKWNIEVMEAAEFPVKMLPTIKRSGETAGLLSQNWFDIPSSMS